MGSESFLPPLNILLIFSDIVPCESPSELWKRDRPEACHESEDPFGRPYELILPGEAACAARSLAVPWKNVSALAEVERRRLATGETEVRRRLKGSRFIPALGVALAVARGK